jgi:hypothetical protein
LVGPIVGRQRREGGAKLGLIAWSEPVQRASIIERIIVAVELSVATERSWLAGVFVRRWSHDPLLNARNAHSSVKKGGYSLIFVRLGGVDGRMQVRRVPLAI